ncbi:MAG: rod shape-determining protein MreC [Clostridia bacterium]|nr:rod shape-determining protein MreC [Clostridia bacterium]
MRSFFKTKFFYVITALTVIAVVFPTVMCATGHTSFFRNAVNFIITPLSDLAHDAVDSIDGYARYVYNFDRLVEENKALKAENDTLKEEVYKSRELEEQYEWISEYLELKMQNTSYKFVAADVCGSESGNYSSVFMLDVGTADGVEKNMPVLSGGVVLGYIAEVGVNWSRATSILESSSSVGVFNERSGVTGVLEGEYSLSSEGICRINYLEENADIKVGDRILTSGYGSVYPRGLVVGYVERIEDNEFSRTVTAYVRPEAFNISDADKISKVMVITEYESYTEQ